jgi:hypothetical protein
MSLPTIKVTDPNGNTVEVPASARKVYERQGYTVAADQDTEAEKGTGVRNDSPAE